MTLIVVADSLKHTSAFRPLCFSSPPSFSSRKKKMAERRRKHKQGVGLTMGVFLEKRSNLFQKLFYKSSFLHLRNEHPQMSNYRCPANEANKGWNVPPKSSCWWGLCSQVMLDVSADMGVEGVDSVNVHPGRAPLVFSPIYVTIYSCVYRSCERFTCLG